MSLSQVHAQHNSAASIVVTRKFVLTSFTVYLGRTHWELKKTLICCIPAGSRQCSYHLRTYLMIHIERYTINSAERYTGNVTWIRPRNPQLGIQSTKPMIFCITNSRPLQPSTQYLSSYSSLGDALITSPLLFSPDLGLFDSSEVASKSLP